MSLKIMSQVTCDSSRLTLQRASPALGCQELAGRGSGPDHSSWCGLVKEPRTSRGGHHYVAWLNKMLHLPAQITGHCQASTAHWTFVYEDLGVSSDVWAAKPKLRLQSLSSRWLGALQTNFSRKSKVSRAEAPPQIQIPLSASQSAALGAQGASA